MFVDLSLILYIIGVLESHREGYSRMVARCIVLTFHLSPLCTETSPMCSIARGGAKILVDSAKTHVVFGIG